MQRGQEMKKHSESALKKKYAETGIKQNRLESLFDCLTASAAFYYFLEYEDLLRVIRINCGIAEEEFLRLVPIISIDDRHSFILGNGKELWDGGPDVTVLVSKGMVLGLNTDLSEEDAERYLELGEEYDGPSPVVRHWDEVQELRQKTAGKPLYFPPDLLDYADEDYFEETPQTEAMLWFLMNTPEFDRHEYDPDGEIDEPRWNASYDAVLSIIDSIKGNISNPAGRMQRDVDYLGVLGFSFRNKDEVKQFAALYVDLSNNTRIPANRGFTPNEMNGNIITGNPSNRRYGSFARTLPGLPHEKEKKPGPNAPCPCGSGKKFKKCCGAGGG